MNSGERDLLIELKTDIKYIRNSIKDFKGEIKEHNDKLDDNGKQLAVIESNQSNHLKHHEQLRRELFTKLSIVVSAIAIISSIILKLFIG